MHSPHDVAAALLAFGALHAWRVPPWLVVPALAGAGGLVIQRAE